MQRRNKIKLWIMCLIYCLLCFILLCHCLYSIYIQLYLVSVYIYYIIMTFKTTLDTVNIYIVLNHFRQVKHYSIHCVTQFRGTCLISARQSRMLPLIVNYGPPGFI